MDSPGFEPGGRHSGVLASLRSRAVTSRGSNPGVDDLVFPTRIARGASLLLRAARRVASGKLSGLAGTERTPKAFARVGESTTERA